MVKVNNVINGYLNGSGNNKDEGEIKAAALIKELLATIDLNAEVVPENNLDMFSRLIASLKGGNLNKDEITVINKIINFEYK
jgi:hypothetical protein